MSNIKKFLSKRFIITILILGLCFACVIIVTMINCKSGYPQYIAISSTFDHVVPGSTTFTTYDKKFNKISSESIDLGCGGPGVIDNQDEIYFFAGRSYISLDKNTGKYKQYPNIIDRGVIEAVNGMGQCPVLVKNVGFISSTEYDCEVCVIDDLNNPSISSFKTQNSSVSDAIKFNDMFYVVTQAAEDSRDMFLEVYDSEYNFIVKNKIYFDSAEFKFYVSKDNTLYLFNFLDNSTSVYKVNKEGTLNDVPSNKFTGYCHINQINRKVYCTSNDGGILEVNIDESNCNEILNVDKLMPEHTVSYDYTNTLLFDNDKFVIRTIARLPLDLVSEVNACIKIYIQDGNKYIESKVLSETDLINSREGKSLIYFGSLYNK